MNRLYLIIPLVLIACFGVAYRFEAEGQLAQEQSQAAATALAARKADDDRQALERQAKTDADQRLASRVADEQKQAADRQALWDADERRIDREIADAKAAVAAREAELAKLQPKLDTLVATQSRLNRENFELEKAAELAKISERNGETEIQRLAEIVAGKAATALHPSVSR
jgi:hypothetical protein